MSEHTNESEESAELPSSSVRPRRRWLQISLRRLLLLIALVAVAALAASWYEAPFRRQREAMAAIEKAGGSYQAVPAGPAWLRRLLGEDAFRHVTLVNVADCEEPAAYLEHLARLPAIETLVVGGPAFADEHLQRLHGLTTLRGLVLDCTEVTDEGIAELRGALSDVEVCRSQRRSIAILEQLGCDLKKKPIQNARLGHVIGSAWFEELISADVHNVAFGDADGKVLRALYSLQYLSIPAINVASAATIARLKAERRKKGRPPTASVTDAALANLEGLRQLLALNLESQAGVTDAGMRHLRGLAELFHLTLNGTRVGDLGLSELKYLDKLQSLYLRNTPVTDAGLAQLKELNRLHNLFLRGTAVSDAGVAHLVGLPLEFVELDDTQVTDASLELLKGQKALWGLSLNGTAISDAGLAHLGGLKLLRSLQLSRTRIRGDGLQHLSELKMLTEIRLDETQVDDQGIAQLGLLGHLQSVWLSGTKITDAAIPHLKRLAKLRSLRLMATGVTADGEAQLRSALPACQIMRAPVPRKRSQQGPPPP